MLQLIVDALSIGSLYALLALGIALIFGIMGLINFAHGENIMVAAFVMLAAHVLLLPLYIIVTVVAAGFFALLTERIAFRPLRNADAATLLVSSFAVSYLVQNSAILVFSGRTRAISTPINWLGSFEWGGVTISYIDIFVTLVTVACLVGLAILLKFTNLGIQMRAAAEDFRMARLSGVKAQLVIPAAFLISGLLAGVAAFLFLAKVGSFNAAVGLPLILPAIVAAVIGGLGSMVGAVVGGYLLGFATVFLQVLLPSTLVPFRDVFVFLMVIIVLQIRPQGLFSVHKERI